MDVNRSGYYKWRNRKDVPNRYEQDRKSLTRLLTEEHRKHKVYGYHRLANVIRSQTGWFFSDNLAHQCCKYAGIKSAARRKSTKPIGQEHVSFKNIVDGKWTSKKPLEIVVSDMTCFYQEGTRYEWTYMLDTFNNEIISYALTDKYGDNIPYYKCLEGLKSKLTDIKKPVILHTDQGSVYSSKAFKEAHNQFNITRSMSRVGTPTDNPIIEALNGWIKDELKIDFGNIPNFV